jgi:hypothetical protein
MQSDHFGNRFVHIGKSNTLFSCHTDTVHKSEGLQQVYYDSISDQLFVTNGQADCLGADDGSGIWLMLQMIKNNIPGLYIFHRCEEIGGIGSQWIVDNNISLLDGIDHAIAFDRKGKTSVITHMFDRVCSDQFASDLSELLGMGFTPDNTGVFTDTAQYTHIIPECTNISVGYNLQHSSREYQECGFLLSLRDRLLSIDWTQLKAYRDPSKPDPDNYWNWEDDWKKPAKNGRFIDYYDALDYVYNNPENAAELLLDAYGIDYGYSDKVDLFKYE